MDDEGILELLEKEKNKIGSIRKLSDIMGISATFLSFVLRGESNPTEKIYNYFGYTKVCRLEKIKK